MQNKTKLLYKALKMLMRTNYADVAISGTTTVQELALQLKYVKKHRKAYKVIQQAILQNFGNTNKSIHIEDLRETFNKSFIAVAYAEQVLVANGWAVQKG